MPDGLSTLSSPVAARKPRGTYRRFYNASDSTNDGSLLILSSKVERLEREMQELTRAVVRFQEETKASLERVKEGLDNFMSSITIADEQPGETPREEAPRGAAQTT